ncbi:hypothetical protein L195_g047506, partial [Trifolium pratense]
MSQRKDQIGLIRMRGIHYVSIGELQDLKRRVYRRKQIENLTVEVFQSPFTLVALSPHRNIELI